MKKSIDKCKVAICTEWLVQYGGAEKTVEAIMEMFPEAPIYTAKYQPGKMPDNINKRTIVAPKKTWLSRMTQYFFAFAMAPVFEEFDFNEYDIILSSGTTWPKGIIAKPGQLHVSYLHTPPRFLYGYSTESTKRDKWYFKLVFSYVDNIFRLWDFVAAQRPDFMLTNSRETLRRIKKFYRRDATVMYPPIDTDMGDIEITAKTRKKYNLKEPYFMILGRLAAYKNFDAVIDAFNKLGKPLVVVGTGAVEKKLRKIAKDNIIFAGRAPEREKHELLDGCLGVINSVDDEDLGIVPIEAQSHGKPVLAYGSGGHLETVVEGTSGMFFNDLDTEKLANKVLAFESEINAGKYDPEKIKNGVLHFSKERFQREYYEFVKNKWEELQQKSNA